MSDILQNRKGKINLPVSEKSIDVRAITCGVGSGATKILDYVKKCLQKVKWKR